MKQEIREFICQELLLDESADLADDVPGGHLVTHRHKYLAQVQEGGGQAITVIEDNGAPGVEEVRLRQGHHPGSGGLDRSPGGHPHIHPVVGTAGHAVVDALATVNP